MVKRDPLQVDPEFRKRLKELQKRIEQAEGRDVSIRELTERIARSGGVEELERKLLANRINTFDVKIKLDRRLLG